MGSRLTRFAPAEKFSRRHRRRRRLSCRSFAVMSERRRLARAKIGMFPLHLRHFADVMFFARANEEKTRAKKQSCIPRWETSHERGTLIVTRRSAQGQS